MSGGEKCTVEQIIGNRDWFHSRGQVRLLWTSVRGISLKVGWKSRPPRLVAVKAGKNPWMAAFLETYGGRLAIKATMEPPVPVSRNQRAKIPDEWRASIGLGGCREGYPPHR